jgi:hypothetical protein
MPPRPGDGPPRLRQRDARPIERPTATSHLTRVALNLCKLHPRLMVTRVQAAQSPVNVGVVGSFRGHLTQFLHSSQLDLLVYGCSSRCVAGTRVAWVNPITACLLVLLNRCGGAFFDSS